MEIHRIDATLLRILGGDATTGPSVQLPLVLGERLAALVTGQLGDGRVLLEVRGRSLEAKTALPLVPGQSLELEVEGLGPEVILRVASGGPVVSERNFALGALSVARQSAPSIPPPDVGALLALLERDVARLSDAQRAEVARLLGPLRAAAGPEALAVELRHALENGGLLFESRVREWLQQSSTPLPATPALPPTVSSDLKVLLGIVGRALDARGPTAPASPTGATGAASTSPVPDSPARPGESDTRSTAVPGAAATRQHVDRTPGDPLRQRAVHLVQKELDAAGHGDPHAIERLKTEHARVKEELLSRQVETAYHWVRNGTLSVQWPIAFGDHTAQAWLRFHRGLERREEGEVSTGSEAFAFDFALEPPGLGPLRAHVAWTARHLRVSFYVARQPTAAAIAEALPTLTTALEEGGFPGVDASVSVDEVQSRLEPMPAMLPPPGGSILNLRA